MLAIFGTRDLSRGWTSDEADEIHHGLVIGDDDVVFAGFGRQHLVELGRVLDGFDADADAGLLFELLQQPGREVIGQVRTTSFLSPLDSGSGSSRAPACLPGLAGDCLLPGCLVAATRAMHETQAASATSMDANGRAHLKNAEGMDGGFHGMSGKARRLGLIIRRAAARGTSPSIHWWQAGHRTGRRRPVPWCG